MITPKNIFRHELIGLKVSIIGSSNPSLIGLRGEVIYETRNMLWVSVKGDVKKIPKEVCTFEFKLPRSERVVVEGEHLVGRPERRLKKRVRRPLW